MSEKRKRKKSRAALFFADRKVKSAETFVLPVLFGIFLLLLWQTGVLNRLLNTDTFTLPVPGRILQIMSDNRIKIWTNTKATVFVALAGLVSGSLIGYLIAIFAALNPIAPDAVTFGWLMTAMAVVAMIGVLAARTIGPVENHSLAKN